RRWFFFFQAEDGIRDKLVTGVQTCALPIWSAFTSSAAVSAIASSPASRVVPGRTSPAVVAARNRHGTVLRSAIPVHPRPRPPPARERHGRRATVEIVTLLAVKGRENFGRGDPIQLTAHRATPVDQPGIRPEVEQPATHTPLTDERGSGREHAMQPVAAHQRPVRKQERWGDGQDVLTACSTAPRKSFSGTAPSNCTRSLMTIFGTPMTW